MWRQTGKCMPSNLGEKQLMTLVFKTEASSEIVSPYSGGIIPIKWDPPLLKPESQFSYLIMWTRILTLNLKTSSFENIHWEQLWHENIFAGRKEIPVMHFCSVLTLLQLQKQKNICCWKTSTSPPISGGIFLSVIVIRFSNSA